MTRVLSGVQPTGNLHLGNYLGAIKNWVAMQHQHESLFCIVDLHAITVPQDPSSLREATLTTAAAYIACGIDPVKSTIFHQSAVPEHSELAWLFSTITPMGWLNRMTQFKDKAKVSEIKYLAAQIHESTVDIAKVLNANVELKHSDNYYYPVEPLNKLESIKANITELSNSLEQSDSSNLGLYAYPVLMAADILLYHATHVPVGEDQKQHLELARDIAGAFNRQYKKQTPKPYFRLPEPMILGAATRVMSLKDGTKKMSKSEESDQSRINLTDSADVIMQKMKKATTDSISEIYYDVENRPSVSNLLNIFSAVTGEKAQDIALKYQNSGMANFKMALGDALIAHLGPITAELTRLKGDKAYLEGLLKQGANRARLIAGENIAEIKKIMGFLQG